MHCAKCKNIAVYTRKYSGESLCSECFSNSILRKTAKTISKKPDDQVPIVEFTTSSTSAYINLSILSEFGSISTLSINDYFIIGDEGLDGVSDCLV